MLVAGYPTRVEVLCPRSILLSILVIFTSQGYEVHFVLKERSGIGNLGLRIRNEMGLVPLACEDEYWFNPEKHHSMTEKLL